MDIDENMARYVRALAGTSPARRLPGIHALARTFHTGTGRVSRVLRQLRSEGVVEFSRGRCVRPVRAAGPEPAAQPAAGVTERVVRAIQEAIEDGAYPAGTKLPKVEFLAQHTSASYNTVCRALATLRRAHLVHRSGRGYAAGSRRQTVAGTLAHPSRVVLVLQADQQWWQGVPGLDWLSPFNLSFMREANNANTLVVPVFYRPTAHAFQISGEDAIRRYVRDLGPRYCGALIAGQSWNFVFTGQKPVHESVRWLVQLGRPVVWFDLVDEVRWPKDTFDTSAYAQVMALSDVKRRFTRCHFCADDSEHLVIDTLYALGHRRIGIPWFGDDSPVMHERRVELLVRIARGYPGLSVHVHTVPGLPGNRRTIALTAVMAPLIRKMGVSAIIAPNDERAVPYYLWLRTMGYDVPADMSFVSFDASARLLHPWQISSVDFGFMHLGYTAYHMIAQDIPVPRRGTDFPARCRFNHTGSLGPPPTRG